MLSVLALSSAAWTALASWVTALASTVTAAVLTGSLLYARRQWGQAVDIRERQTRPYVVADLRDNPSGTSVFLVVFNYGNTAARNVRFQFDQPPVSSVWDEQNSPLAEMNLLKAGVPTLPPGKEVVAMFDSIPERLERGLPMSYSVYLSYEDQTGAKTYGPEEYVLDLKLYVGLLAEGTRGLDAIADSLQSIDQQIRMRTSYD